MKKLFFLLLSNITMLTLVFAQQPGMIDSTFNPGDIGFGNGDGASQLVSTIAIQRDGKIIIGGEFTTYNGTNRNHIARLNVDGTLDTTFKVGTGANNFVNTASIQSDGKIIIGGEFTTYNGISRNNIARLNADGTVDTTFKAGTGVKVVLGANFYVKTTAIQNDGKIIIGGSFTTYNGKSRNNIARLNTDGNVDTTFKVGTGTNDYVLTSSIQSDGKIIIGGNFITYNGISTRYITRLNTDGTVDNTFNIGTGADNYVCTAVVQSDGKIIIGGSFFSYNGRNSEGIARLNADGSLDNTFSVGTGVIGTVYTTATQSDGKIIIGGGFYTYNGTNRSHITRLNANGSLDFTFAGKGTSYIVYTSVKQSDGKIIIGGLFTTYNETSRYFIARIDTDGSSDNTFNGGTGANNYNYATVYTSALQRDGKIIIGGDFTRYNGTTKNHIARLNADGSSDNTFNIGTGANLIVRTIAIQNDGKIIIGGDFFKYNGIHRNCITRLNADGTLDNTFTIATAAYSNVYTTVLQSDGKIIIGGNFTSYNGTVINRIARLNADGTLDNAFNVGTGVNNTVATTAIQSDGKIIFAGNFTSYNGTIIYRIARINANGTIDNTFNVGTGVNDIVSTIVLQSDGKIIIGGSFSAYNGTGRSGIARLNTDGTLDNTFSIGTGASGINTISIQSDGKIVIGGNFTSYNGTMINRLARLNADGSIDTSFNVGNGASYTVWTTAIQSDEKIIIGGEFTSYNGKGKNRIVRVAGACLSPPVINSMTPTSRCDNGTLVLGVIPTLNTINWYASQTGGSPLFTGENFTTPFISETTTYYVDATDNACTSSRKDVTASINALPTLTINGTNTICAGNSTTLSASGADTYLWTSGPETAINVVSPLTGTTYTVTGTTASGCTGTSSVLVIVNALPLPTVIISGTTTICAGNSTTLSARGADTYLWTSGTATATNIVSPLTDVNYTVTGTVTATGCTNISSQLVIVNVLPTLTISGTNAICAGSSTTLSASGADTYLWTSGPAVATNIVSPLTDTIYTVAGTITATGCTNKSLQLITVNALPTLSMSGTNTICSGSSTTLSVSGADTYLWISGPATATNVVSPLISTIYTAIGTITATGCTNTSSQLITVNASPTLSISGTNTICAGSPTTLSASGADTYLWASGPATSTNIVSPLTGTTYTLTGKITATGCASISSQLITVNALPSVSVSFFSNISCFGRNDGVIMLNSAGGLSPYGYSWFPTGGSSTSASSLVQGTYSISISDKNACKSTISQTITQPATALSVNVSGTDASCSGCSDGSASATASGGTFPYNFSWSGLQTTAAIIGLTAKEYTVCVTDVNGCSTCKNYVVNQPTGISSFISDQGIKIYPNPSDNFIIELGDFNKALPYEVTDVFGRTIISGQLSDKNTLLNFSAFDAGVYMLRVNDKVLRLIKN